MASASRRQVSMRSTRRVGVEGQPGRAGLGDGDLADQQFRPARPPQADDVAGADPAPDQAARQRQRLVIDLGVGQLALHRHHGDGVRRRGDGGRRRFPRAIRRAADRDGRRRAAPKARRARVPEGGASPSKFRIRFPSSPVPNRAGRPAQKAPAGLRHSTGSPAVLPASDRTAANSGCATPVPSRRSAKPRSCVSRKRLMPQFACGATLRCLGFGNLNASPNRIESAP